ncbi:STM3941 family protein [Anaerocolumna xylanovorans]|uniref:Uncharacterized protein n=1 Tax=Anaerocolumna xylanovorans DSM 12503 TaxID=1121345 RepID=A0A1M7Y9E5_9FIRM|nr:STM3941 family protein [Anaerocolumna xylanovorans]SHO49186.1 hypothetical protein SAMN02745217_02180 [Anaerocolumna xylanovorans DSM 12503]
MEKIIIEEKQTKAVRCFMRSFALLFLAVTLWVTGLRERYMFLVLAGIIATVIFSISCIMNLSKASQKKPLITITFDGIIDGSSKNSIGMLSYQDIERFCIVKEDDAIGIIPRDEESFIKKLSPIKQQKALDNKNYEKPVFLLYVGNARDMSLEDIYTLLKKRLDDYRSLYD